MNFRDILNKIDAVKEEIPSLVSTPASKIGDPVDMAKRSEVENVAKQKAAQLRQLQAELTKALLRDTEQNQTMFGSNWEQQKSVDESISFAKDLVESFDYTFEAEATLGKTAAIAGAGKTASKILGKALPGVGTALSWKDAYDRAKEGDFLGAGLAGLAGAAYLVPGVGTAVGTGLDAVNIGRDLSSGDGEEQGAQPKTDQNKLVQLQKIVGAKADGIMGPETSEKLKAWQASKGIKVDGIPGPETYSAAGLSETVAESIKSLTEKLALLEATDDQPVMIEKNGKYYALLPDGQLVDEEGNLIDGTKQDLPIIGKANLAEAAPGIGSALKSAFAAAKSKLANIGANFKSGLTGGSTVQMPNPKYPNLAGKAAPGGIAARKAGSAIRNNPIKSAGAAGLGVGYALGGPAGGGAKPANTGGAGSRRSASGNNNAATGQPQANPNVVAPGQNKEVQEIVRQMSALMTDMIKLNDPVAHGTVVDAERQIKGIEGLPPELANINFKQQQANRMAQTQTISNVAKDWSANLK